MASFDAKRVTPLEWAGIGAGALAFIASFFNWYSVSFSVLGVSSSVGANAWDMGFLTILSVLMLIGAGVLVLLPHFGTEVPNLTLIWLGLAAASVVFIVLRWITYGGNDLATLDSNYSAGAGFGLYLGLLCAIVSGVAAFLVYRGASARSTAA